MVEAGRRREIAETEVASQRVHRSHWRAEELPVRLVDSVLRSEGAHRFGRIRRLVEADADHVEGIGAEHLVHRLQRLLQRTRAGRADLKAAGVDEAHQQRLAAVARQAHRPTLAVEQRVVGQQAADGGLAGAQGLAAVECGRRRQRIRRLHDENRWLPWRGADRRHRRARRCRPADSQRQQCR